MMHGVKYAEALVAFQYSNSALLELSLYLYVATELSQETYTMHYFLV